MGIRKNIIDHLLRLLAIRANVQVGVKFHAGPGTTIWAPRSLRIGDDVYVGKHVTIEVDGEIGDGVLIANSVGVVGRTDHDRREIGASIRRSKWVGDHPDLLSRATVIGSDVWIGYGAIVMSGVSIGDSSIIAAGALVTRDVPSNSIVVGNPGKVIGERFTADELNDHWARLQASGHRILIGKKGKSA